MVCEHGTVIARRHGDHENQSWRFADMTRAITLLDFCCCHHSCLSASVLVVPLPFAVRRCAHKQPPPLPHLATQARIGLSPSSTLSQEHRRWLDTLKRGGWVDEMHGRLSTSAQPSHPSWSASSVLD